MKYALILILVLVIVAFLAVSPVLLLVALPYLVYDRRCKMLERIECGEIDEKKEKPNFMKSAFSLVNDWANKSNKS